MQFDLFEPTEEQLRAMYPAFYRWADGLCW